MTMIQINRPSRGALSKESPKDNFNKGFKGNYLFYAPGPPLHWFPWVVYYLDKYCGKTQLAGQLTLIHNFLSLDSLAELLLDSFDDFYSHAGPR